MSGPQEFAGVGLPPRIQAPPVQPQPQPLQEGAREPLNLSIFFMRHAKSCSNMLRESAKGKPMVLSNILKDASRVLQDPPLSNHGKAMAEAYADELKRTLTANGILTPSTIIGSSDLTRAQQTARILFGPQTQLHIFPYLAEKGNIPENKRRLPETQIAEIRAALGAVAPPTEEISRNTAARINILSQVQETGWGKFTGYLENDNSNRNRNMIIVGHGAYLKEVYETLKKQQESSFVLPPDFKLNNMDGFTVKITNNTYSVVGDIIRAADLVRTDMDKCPVRLSDKYPAFPLRKYTTDPTILKYRQPIFMLYNQIMRESQIPSFVDPSIIYSYLKSLKFPDILNRFTDDPIVKALFIKIYDLIPLQVDWPPLDYPITAPPLYTVPGYSMESPAAFVHKILQKLGKNKGDTERGVFNYLREGINAQTTEADIIQKMREVSDIENIKEKYTEWGAENKTEGSTMLVNAHPIDRFIRNFILKYTWDQLQKVLSEDEYYTEFERYFARGPVQNKFIRRKLTDRYQQLYVIVPFTETDYTHTFYTIGDPEVADVIPLAFNETRWIKFSQKVIASEPSLDGDNYNLAMVIQGFKIRDHPGIREALRAGPPLDAHPDVRRMFPEWWGTETERILWLETDLTFAALDLPSNVDYLETIQDPTELLTEIASPEFEHRYKDTEPYAAIRRKLNRKIFEKTGGNPATPNVDRLFKTMPAPVRERALRQITTAEIKAILEEVRTAYFSEVIDRDPLLITLDRLNDLCYDPSTRLTSLLKRAGTWCTLYVSSGKPAVLIQPLLATITKLQDEVIARKTLPVLPFQNTLEDDFKKQLSNTITPIYWALEAMKSFRTKITGAYTSRFTVLLSKDLVAAATEFLRATKQKDARLFKEPAERALQAFQGKIEESDLQFSESDFTEDKTLDPRLRVETPEDENGLDTTTIVKSLYNLFARYRRNKEGKLEDIEANPEFHEEEQRILHDTSLLEAAINKLQPSFSIKARHVPRFTPIVTDSLLTAGSADSKKTTQTYYRQPQQGREIAVESDEEDEEDDTKVEIPKPAPGKKLSMTPPTPVAGNQTGGAFQILDTRTRVSIEIYRETARQILTIFYSQLIPSSTPSIPSTSSTPSTTLALDALANLADIDPSLACKKILETKNDKDIAELNKFLGVEPATYFKSMKCPKKGAFKTIIESYKKRGNYAEATLLQRLQTLADNKKVTDQQLYNKFLEFKPRLSEYTVELDKIQPTKGIFGTTPPKRDELIRSVLSILNTGSLPPASLPPGVRPPAARPQGQGKWSSKSSRGTILRAEPLAVPAQPAAQVPLENPEEASLRIDILSDAVDIDPPSACKTILATESRPNLNIKESSKITRSKGLLWGEKITCPPAAQLKNDLAAYKTAYGLPPITGYTQLARRVQAYIDNPKSKDAKIWEKFQELLSVYNAEIAENPLGVDQRQDPVPVTTKGGFFSGLKYPPRVAVRNYIDHLSTLLRSRPPPSIGINARREPRPLYGPGSSYNTIVPPPVPVSREIKGGYRKTAAPTRKMPRKQRGGGVTMPLGFYQDGAQMRGTYGSETGVGLGVMTENMARSALVQTGGRKKATRRRNQRGGFTPSVMGSFAANGLSLLPVASYMGYRMMNKKGKTRKGKAGRTGRKRLTRRH